MSRCLIASLAVLLTCSASDAFAQKGKKKGNVRGTVVEVKKDADKETGTITISVIMAKKKKDAAAPPAKTEAEKKTFKVTPETKVETIVGKPKDGKTEPAKFSSIESGATVIIKADGDTAKDIRVAAKKKKKKAK